MLYVIEVTTDAIMVLAVFHSARDLVRALIERRNELKQ